MNHPDEVEIRATVESWHQATRAGDVARVLALMDEEAVFLRAGAPPIRGRAAFGRDLRALLQTHEIVSSGQVQEVQVSGDLGYCWTDLSVKVTPLEGGEPTVRTGPALSIFRRQADRIWLLVRDANMLAPDTAELELKVDNLEREIMADGPGGD